jgi:protein phosphatase-4 regulatory subunit 3
MLDYHVTDEDFKRQGDTILIWVDAEANTYALSFQDVAGSNDIWKAICNAKGVDPAVFWEANSDEEECLPQLSLENIETFHSALTELPLSRKERIGSLLIQGDYLASLGELLGEAEAKGPASKLPVFFFIFKDLVHLNHSELLEEMLSEAHYLTLFGALEHDPDLNGRQFNSRDFLTKTLKFKNVLNITNEEFLRKVHMAYRLQYLKDTVLARCLDDATIGHLTAFNLALGNELIQCVTRSTDIRGRLVLKLESGNFEAFCFLNELSLTAKQALPTPRNLFYEALCDDGILELLGGSLNRDELTSTEYNKLRVITADLVISLLQTCPHLIKRHFVSQQEKEASFPFLKHICAAFLESEDISVQQQISELLRILLSPEEQDSLYELCDVFYDQIMQSFAEKLQVNAVDLEETRLSLCEVLNILTQCMLTHSPRMRFFLLYNDVLQRSLRLFELNDKTVMLAALKFFRAVASHHDRYLQEFLISHKFFKPILKVFKANGDKENMLFHSVLALLEVVRTSQCFLLVESLVSKHLPEFLGSPLEKYFDGVKAVHDEQIERSVKLAAWSALESSAKEDEDYFAEDSDEAGLQDTFVRAKRKRSSDSDDNPSKMLKPS